MQASQEQMHQELRRLRAASDHNLTKGQNAEEVVRKFLRKHLPLSIGVAQGQLVDTAGNSSKQLDVILYDTSRTPILFSSNEEGSQVIPVEGAIAVIEVKTKVTASDASSIWDHMQSVKNLEKSAYFLKNSLIQTTTRIHGREQRWSPTLYFLWSYECRNPSEFVKKLSSIAQPYDPSQRIDMALFLDGSVMLNFHEDGPLYDAVPGPGTRYANYPTPNALLMWYMMSSVYLLQPNIPPINLTKYLPRNVGL